VAAHAWKTGGGTVWGWLSYDPEQLAVSLDGRRVYVATGRGNTVVVFDAESYEVLATIPVGQRVWGLAVTADGKNSTPPTVSQTKFR
jgi:YVTN family beta-propeller protein